MLTNFFSLFIDKKRINAVKDIELHDYDDIVDFLRKECSSEKTWLSSNSSHAIVTAIKEVNCYLVGFELSEIMLRLGN